MINIDHEINFTNTSIITYIGSQNTNRDHYTGIMPDENELDVHLTNPPYGNSIVKTFNSGIQINHKSMLLPIYNNKFTFGLEYINDDVWDNISSYNYTVDQTTKNIGLFLQSDLTFSERISLLSGFRIDQHNMIDDIIINPRGSLLYKMKNSQIRISYGHGFRAPQAFDSDLHMAFAGGGVSRVNLSENLLPETSKSISISINYDKSNQQSIFGFSLETFYTKLKNAFILEPLGEDEFGFIFEKRNGNNAVVQGLTFESRFNYNQKIQLQSGITLQSNRFSDAVTYIEDVEPINEFIKTPKNYAYSILTLYPYERITMNLNYMYTGKMKVPHISSANNRIIQTDRFHEINGKLNYIITQNSTNVQFEFYIGVKNILNAYQNDFDIGKNRDSNFIYGPAQPRTILIGIKAKH